MEKGMYTNYKRKKKQWYVVHMSSYNLYIVTNDLRYRNPINNKAVSQNEARIFSDVLNKLKG